MARFTHRRAYLQSRIREEMARGGRYGRSFSLLVLESRATDAMPAHRKLQRCLEAVEASVRPSDTVRQVFEDTIAVLFVEADDANAADALQRVRSRIATVPGIWHIATYSYPKHEDAIRGLELFNAA